jgi:hydroxymethylpyrimidine kinase/phosphomethylpyrimidine kinase/thiamine-phosphate diphosphorylase
MLHFSNNHSLSNSQTVKPIVWSIAASNTFGDDGIRADSLTIQDLGGHACQVITAVTEQNAEVTADNAPKSSKLMINQLNYLLNGLMPSAIKIGMLVNAKQFQLISQWLETVLVEHQQKHKLNIPIIWDPTMASARETSLTFVKNKPTVHDYLCLAKQVTLITLNEYQLKQLADMCKSEDVSSQSTVDYVTNALSTSILVIKGDSDNENTID